MAFRHQCAEPERPSAYNTAKCRPHLLLAEAREAGASSRRGHGYGATHERRRFFGASTRFPRRGFNGAAERHPKSCSRSGCRACTATTTNDGTAEPRFTVLDGLRTSSRSGGILASGYGTAPHKAQIRSHRRRLEQGFALALRVTRWRHSMSRLKKGHAARGANEPPQFN